LSEIVKNRKRGGRIRVEHCAPVSHELPVLEAGIPATETFRGPEFPPEETGRMPGDPAPSFQGSYRQGFEEGVAEGIRRAEASAAARRDQDHAGAATLAASLQEQFARYAERLEREAFRFALAVAGRILRREILLDDQVILRQVKEALHRVVGAETVSLRVHPADEPLLRDRRNELLASGEGVREIMIEPDESVGRGGCIIESPSGNIDARIATQLAQIDTALFGSGRAAGTTG
jgi:flagellar biosynthesis/type III secretory pathway protein FliH